MEIPLNIDLQQILLHVFNFAVLTGGLYFLLYSPIEKFIEKRNAYYRELDAAAKEKLETAQVLEEKAKESFYNVDAEIKEKRMKAMEELEQYAQARRAEAKAEADKILADAKSSAEKEKQAVRDSADRDIINMTRELAAKMVYSSTDEAYSHFLDIAERNE